MDRELPTNLSQKVILETWPIDRGKDSVTRGMADSMAGRLLKYRFKKVDAVTQSGSYQATRLLALRLFSEQE